MSESKWDGFPSTTFRPTPQEIEKLITAAHKHPLGIKFLLEGDLGAVAVTFGIHAFTVEAARDHLKTSRPEE